MPGGQSEDDKKSWYFSGFSQNQSIAQGRFIVGTVHESQK